jgi:putative PIG3 family NAD(P)H quinone oxidoreductase
MRAVVASEPGPPEVLAIEEVADPSPQAGELVINVVAAGVNRADLLQRQGHYSPPPGAPTWLGLECSGTVTALGAGVSGWSVGDEVCALLTGGGYAEQVAVPAGQVLPVPQGVDLAEAAGLPEVACTVWSNVIDVGRLQPGETLLVHGGGSGIGTMAIQVARALGARVLVTCGSDAKVARCAELGAEGINYQTADFVEATKSLTDGNGANLILDVIGAKYLSRNIDALATGGRVVVIGLQGGVKGELNLGQLMGKRASIHGTTLRARPAAQQARSVAAVRADGWPVVEAGESRPVIDRIVDWSDAGEAHRAMESGQNFGKILLRVTNG